MMATNYSYILILEQLQVVICMPIAQYAADEPKRVPQKVGSGKSISELHEEQHMTEK